MLTAEIPGNENPGLLNYPVEIIVNITITVQASISEEMMSACFQEE